VALRHYMLNSAAWRDLNAVSRCLYVELARRFMGQNNGKIPYSVREGAKELGISKATVSRSFRQLIDHGFIVITQAGHFDYKMRHATEWRLTEFDCGNDLATKDFMRWQLLGGELATALPSGALARRFVPSKRVPPGRLEVSLS
jgi:biotin operon repressor